MTEIERIKLLIAESEGVELSNWNSCTISQREAYTRIESNGREWLASLITTIESQKEEIEKLKGVLERLPSKITQLDSWADIEELTFPLLEPTEDAQLEWFDEFIKRLGEHVQSCFDGELYELKSQELESQEGDK